MLERFIKKERRKVRIRARIEGTAKKPRLSVSSSNKHIIAQLVDDQTGQTIAFASDLKIKEKMTKTDKGFKVGEAIAEEAKKKKVTEVVFDRGGKLYHGRVKALAEGARKSGLNF
ncbi:MAG: 50S ribosomal protein L18 [Patescibacteria group bacterium]|jgi:large subunit ribosomal protein L18|nr:50S ribosomal protein L18 [Patescibacteria group bacterium]